jgi:type IV pilus assembly protein PilA
MNTQKMKQGFTLVEIMIVVAIIALLAAIAIPNLMRARMTSNDALAKATLRAMSTAAETFASSNSGNYPAKTTDLTGATPPYLNQDYCTGSPDLAGYTYNCTWSGAGGYYLTANPVTVNVTGTKAENISTGGVLTPTP